MNRSHNMQSDAFFVLSVGVIDEKNSKHKNLWEEN